MLAITALRSFLSAPRRGTVCALLIAVVIAGVVLIHAMSGSPTAHTSWATLVIGDVSHHTDGTEAPPGPMTEPPADAYEDGSGHHEPACECHGTTAMCLMVLATPLILTMPLAGALGRPVASLAQPHAMVESQERPAREPCLHALGICRT